jgi:hypothetical protein
VQVQVQVQVQVSNSPGSVWTALSHCCLRRR